MVLMRVPPEIAVCIKEYVAYDEESPPAVRTRYWRALCIEPRDLVSCLGLSLVDFDSHLLDLFIVSSEEELMVPRAWLRECMKHLRVLRSSALSEHDIICLLTRCAGTLERIEINTFHHNFASQFPRVVESLNHEEEDESESQQQQQQKNATTMTMNGKKPNDNNNRFRRRSDEYHRYHHHVVTDPTSSSSVEMEAQQKQELRASSSDGVMGRSSSSRKTTTKLFGREVNDQLLAASAVSGKGLAFPNLRKIVFPEIQYLYFHQLIALLRADCSPKLEEVHLSIRDWLLLKSLERDLGPEGWQRISRRVGVIRTTLTTTKWDQLERCLRRNLVDSLTVSEVRGIDSLQRLAALAESYNVQSISIRTLIVEEKLSSIPINKTVVRINIESSVLEQSSSNSSSLSGDDDTDGSGNTRVS